MPFGRSFPPGRGQTGCRWRLDRAIRGTHRTSLWNHALVVPRISGRASRTPSIAAIRRTARGGRARMNWSSAWRWRSARIDRSMEVRSSGVALRRAPEQRTSLALVDPAVGVSGDARDAAMKTAERLSIWAWAGAAISAAAGSIALITLRSYTPDRK